MAGLYLDRLALGSPKMRAALPVDKALKGRLDRVSVAICDELAVAAGAAMLVAGAWCGGVGGGESFWGCVKSLAAIGQ